MRYGIPAVMTALMLAGGVQATPVHDEIAFSLADFTHIDGSALDAPFLPITGHFTLDFDNSSDITESTPIAISDFNFPNVGSIGFIYVQWQDMIVLGTHVYDGGCQISVGDFCAFIYPVSQERSAWSGSFLIGLPRDGSYLDAYEDDEAQFMNAAPSPPPSVPEPASWATMLAGFAAVGGILRARRRRIAIRFG